MRVPVLVPDVFKIVLLLGAVFPVHKGALLANEDAVVEHAERRLVFHAVNTAMVTACMRLVQTTLLYLLTRRL